MESLDLGTAVLFLIVGVVVGVALSKLLGKGPSNNELQQKLEDTQDQFEKYQEDVGTHFEQTATLVNKMTDSYREVHEHLSKGAQTLAEESKIALTLDQNAALSLKPLNDESENSGDASNTEINIENNTSDDSASDTSDNNTSDAAEESAQSSESAEPTSSPLNS